MTSTLERTMPKKKPQEAEAGRPKKRPASTKVDAELLRQAKTVASYRGMDLYDYLNDVLRIHVGADFRRLADSILGEGGR